MSRKIHKELEKNSLLILKSLIIMILLSLKTNFKKLTDRNWDFVKN